MYSAFTPYIMTHCSPYMQVHKLILCVKSIGICIGITYTGPVFTWYWIDTKFCSIAHPFTVA